MIRTPTFRHTWTALVATIVAAGLCLNAYWFFVWRINQPPENPGGALGSLGYGVKLWEWLVLMTPFIIGPLVNGVVSFAMCEAGPPRSSISIRTSIGIVLILVLPIVLPGRYPLLVGIPVLLLLAVVTPLVIRRQKLRPPAPHAPSGQKQS